MRSCPTLAGFIAWVRAVMQIPTDVLPDDSPAFTFAFELSQAVVNRYLQRASPPIYTAAVYCLGGDNLINWAEDPPDAPVYKNGLPFFAFMRKQYGINDFLGG